MNVTHMACILAKESRARGEFKDRAVHTFTFHSHTHPDEYEPDSSPVAQFIAAGKQTGQKYRTMV